VNVVVSLADIVVVHVVISLADVVVGLIGEDSRDGGEVVIGSLAIVHVLCAVEHDHAMISSTTSTWSSWFY
jgi:hypothetical protein